ncbi:unnamed protein product [Callosobruchus maculatus]|uniref:Eclosion hormone n=1 Tax=Callosobruchus maculatus TaxID=64391 RepID=A0A653DTC2_CALMS|nr:unnamed protein product [Callosobruchus maculatus]VEN62591.1 unnamed protein product [Callosobruchus maculatus]
MGDLRRMLALEASVMLVLLCSIPIEANPVGICIRNCAQCKKMFGPYFEGQLCADACIKFKGKLIPDCEDITSIAPFLNKFD